MNDLIKRDDLFKAKVNHESKVLAIYSKVLKRVQTRIKHTANLNKGRTECIYLIPDFMLGIPTYNVQDCTVFIITALLKNGFYVNYTHPNMVYISWKHWEKDYEISKSVISGNQKLLINESKRKMIALEHERQRQESEKQARLINQIKEQEKARDAEYKRLKVQRGENPSLVREINIVKENRDNYTRPIENQKEEKSSGGFYELDQIKKIQFLMQNN